MGQHNDSPEPNTQTASARRFEVDPVIAKLADFSFDTFNLNDVSQNTSHEATPTFKWTKLLESTQSNVEELNRNQKPLPQHLPRLLQDELQSCKDLYTNEGFSLFHWVADRVKQYTSAERALKGEALLGLAFTITYQHTEMLLKEDQEGNTPIQHLLKNVEPNGLPLAEAITRYVIKLTDATSEWRKIMSKAISHRNKVGENSLHLAIATDSETIIQSFIDRASDTAFIDARDRDGNTPLHDAVYYSLLKNGTMRCQNGLNLCTDCEKKEKELELITRRRFRQIILFVSRGPEALRKKNKSHLSPYMLYLRPQEPQVISTIPRGRTQEKGPRDKIDSQVDAKGLNAKGCQVVYGRQDEKTVTYLLEKAFSLGSFEASCDCFFADTADSDLDSVFRPERPLSGFVTDMTYPFLKCGTTLAQVDLSIDPMERQGNIGDSSTKQDAERSRNALSNILKMLKEKKNVKRIIKLTVKDNQKIPCTDEIIEDCLDGLDIRYLDWNKPDLCADVVIKKAPRVVEIALYSTGSNAVLRGWAGSNGFANLHNLRRIHLHSEAGLETDRDHQKNIDLFEKELCATVTMTRSAKIVRNLREHNEKLVQHLRQELIQSQEEKTLDPKSQPQSNLKQADLEKTLESESQRQSKLKRVAETISQEKETFETNIMTRSSNLKPQARGSGAIDMKKFADSVDFTETDVPQADYAAMEFEILSRRGQGSTQSGDRLKMKTYMPDDETSLKQHRWVESLRGFVSKYVQGSTSETRVKVALIDDGIDVHLGGLEDRIKDGWPRLGASSRLNPFYRSSVGHGTAMARLIATACPHVDLYVAKLNSLENLIHPDKRRLTDDSSHETWTSIARDAAAAVKWARTKQVHVISMSWSLIRTSSNEAEIQLLSKEIQNAATDGIIMYCAAADQGMYGSVKELYPKEAGGSVKVVGSATESGKHSGFVNPDLVDYLFPGEEFEEIGNRKGSSAATALAAGFAALVLWCFVEQERESPMKGQQAMHPNHRVKRMDLLFRGLQNIAGSKKGGNNGGNNQWVDVCNLLDKDGINMLVDFAKAEIRRMDPTLPYQ